MSLSKLDIVFKNKKTRVLNMYCTAGFPHLESTGEVMKALQEAGADIIELGIPYSDPIADGPVIQDSNNIAIANGIHLEKIFSQLDVLKNEMHVPVILMGYLNPVMQFGFEKFCAEAARVGVSGIILPDLPMQEYDDHYAKMIKKYKLQFIFLVTPATSAERIKAFDKRTGGFLYAVSAAGTTGMKGKEVEPQRQGDTKEQENEKTSLVEPQRHGDTKEHENEKTYLVEPQRHGDTKEQENEKTSLGEPQRQVDTKKHEDEKQRKVELRSNVEIKEDDQAAYFLRLQKMKLKHPVLIGFGISDKKSFEKASNYAAGAIIGSAYIKRLKDGGDVGELTTRFVSSIIK